MNDLGKNTIKGKLRILTPVHIGGAQEKHLQKGLDYITNGSVVYFLDEKKLISHFGIDKYSNALATNSLEKLIKDTGNKPGFFCTHNISISGEIGADIKMNIKNTLTGKPIIPGSSLKGALRSVIYNYASNGEVIPEKDERGRHRNMEQKYFGKIDEDPFRYLIVNDIEFSNSAYVNTKTFNLLSIQKGGWKQSGKSTEQFSSQGFTFPLEIIELDAIGDYEIVINNKALETSIRNNKVKISEKTKSLFENKENIFFKIIQSYSQKYLESERAFFQRYQGEKYELILVEIDRLLQLNEKSPILRVGLGSGFHAMTGDTLHPSHLIDEIARIGRNGDKTRGKNRGEDSAKSRKIAFIGEGDTLQLFPMGFVQLLDENAYKAIQAEIEKEQVERAGQAASILEQNKKQADEEQRRKDELKKPQMTLISALSKNRSRSIDAEVIGLNGTQLILKPFVEKMESHKYEIRYAAGLPMGTIVQVEAILIANNSKLQLSGSPKIKGI
ncbi:MAG: type III-A CRISPR-associated RAMP protein Csm5 [Saprospiraceae bacterium]